MSEWIKCSDKLPEEDGWYLIFDNDGDVNMSEFRNGKWWMWKVTHWQPLPPGPAK